MKTKKLFIGLLLSFCFINLASAQFYVGGSLGFTSSKYSEGAEDGALSGVSYKILPEIGYQYAENLSFGVSFGYVKGFPAMGALDASDYRAILTAAIGTAADISSGDLLGINLKSFRVAPYARYTFMKFDRIEFFVDGMLGVNMINTSGDVSDFLDEYSEELPEGEQKVLGLEVGIRPGMSVTLSPRLKLIAKAGTFGYQRLSVSDSDTTISRFGLEMDSNNLVFGAVYYF